MRRSEERELKLGAPPTFHLPSFDEGDGVVGVAHEAQRLQTLYVDTDDLALTRWGVSLRHRKGEGWTLKLPSEGAGDLLARTELTFEGDARRPPPEVVELIRAYVRTATLEPQVRLRTLRRRLDLQDTDGEVVVRLFDDEVSVLDGRRIAARFRELEAETTDATPDGVLSRVVKRLRDEGAGEPDPTPKVVRALGPRAEEPPDVETARLGSDPTAGDVVRSALAEAVSRLIRHDVVVRLDTDPEGVHQARVATRRLRSHLRTFAPLLSTDWARELRDELGWLAGVLGRKRDADVMLERIRTRATSLSEQSAHGVTRVLAAVEHERKAASDELEEAMRSDRYLSLLDRLVAAARDPALVGDAAAPAKEVLPGLVRRPWRSLAKAAKAVGDPPLDDVLLAVRIRTKRCRYAAEAATPVLGKRARAFASDAAKLQEVLGDFNDAAVAEGWLRDWSARARARDAIFAAGELAGLERAVGDEGRAGWRKAWKRLSRSPQAWMRAA
ncbi:MAG: CHAD domain-containing protein [Gaiellales bacterium]